MVSLIGSRFFVDWSNGQQIESKATLGRMTFFLGGGTLVGAAIENITETEALQLQAPYKVSARIEPHNPFSWVRL